jgi:hypothetical protein
MKTDSGPSSDSCQSSGISSSSTSVLGSSHDAGDGNGVGTSDVDSFESAMRQGSQSSQEASSASASNNYHVAQIGGVADDDSLYGAGSNTNETTIDTYKKAVQEKACDILDNNSQLIDAAQHKYKNLDSPAYDALKQAIKKEQGLKEAEDEAFFDMVEKRRQYDEVKMGALKFPLDADDVKKYEANYEKAQQKHENIQAARQVLKNGYPELTALNMDKIDTDTSNEQIHQNLLKGFDSIRKDIVEAKEKIKNNDVPMEMLTNVLDEVKKDPEFAKMQDEINKWIDDEKFKDKLINWGTTGVTAIATVATLKFGGWGGIVAGAIGTGAGLGGAAYNLERSEDLYDVAQAQQVGEKLSEASLEEAKFNLMMSGVDMALAGVDAGSVIKTLKGLSKIDDAADIAKNIDNIGRTRYKDGIESGFDTTFLTETT